MLFQLLRFCWKELLPVCFDSSNNAAARTSLYVPRQVRRGRPPLSRRGACSPWKSRPPLRLSAASLVRAMQHQRRTPHSTVFRRGSPNRGIVTASRTLPPVTFDRSNKCDRRTSLGPDQPLARGGGPLSPRTHLQGHIYPASWPPPSSSRQWGVSSKINSFRNPNTVASRI